MRRAGGDGTDRARPVSPNRRDTHIADSAFTDYQREWMVSLRARTHKDHRQKRAFSSRPVVSSDGHPSQGRPKAL